MLKKLGIFSVCLLLVPSVVHAACSRANLTRCLDSACAINISANPGARCQYCGCTDAGEAPKKANAMKSVSAGSLTKYNITDKELKSAPTDPGQRYVWATQKCVELVSGCTVDDVTDIYDELIEQSCTAAGVSKQTTVLTSISKNAKTVDTCTDGISACIRSENKCSADFGACTDDSKFNGFFATCITEWAGCDEYTTDIRAKLSTERETAIKNAQAAIEDVVKTHQSNREETIAAERAKCTNNAGRESCIRDVCNQRMPNKCDAGFDDEKSIATQLCKYYDTACAKLKI